VLLQLCNTLLMQLATSGGVPAVKICDWGYSRAMSVDTAARTFVGTSCALPRGPLPSLPCPCGA
jgi:hypothetical protein